MRLQTVAAGVMLSALALCADNRTITFDKGVDFSALKTFSVHEVQINSIRPELKNALFATQMADAVRKALTAKGLKETADHPDFVVDSSVMTHPAGRRGSPGRPVRQVRGTAGPLLTEETLVIDINAGQPAKLVWHGTYRRDGETAAKLAEKLPDDAKKLLSQYPPKKK